MLTPAEKAGLKKYLNSSGFDIVLKCANTLTDKWKDENCVGDNEFNTLKLLFTREGRIGALTEFLTFLDHESQ